MLSEAYTEHFKANLKLIISFQNVLAHHQKNIKDNVFTFD
jgi:hypothetical protein